MSDVFKNSDNLNTSVERVQTLNMKPLEAAIKALNTFITEHEIDGTPITSDMWNDADMGMCVTDVVLAFHRAAMEDDDLHWKIACATAHSSNEDLGRASDAIQAIIDYVEGE